MKKKFNFNELIVKISEKNNQNWMDILRLAFKISQKSIKILSSIYKEDKISNLTKKLTKILILILMLFSIKIF